VKFAEDFRAASKNQPMTARLMDDFDQGEDRISRVDRTRAEEIALLLKTTLPSEADLRKLMQDGASATSN